MRRRRRDGEELVSAASEMGGCTPPLRLGVEEETQKHAGAAPKGLNENVTSAVYPDPCAISGIWGIGHGGRDLGVVSTAGQAGVPLEHRALGLHTALQPLLFGNSKARLLNHKSKPWHFGQL